MHHSCKFVVLSRLICLHFRGFVVKEEIGLKSLGLIGGSMLRMLTVNLMDRYLAGRLHNNEGERQGGRLMG